MLLPQGIEKHKNLSTSFTRFDQLLHDLAENRFSGYLKLNFWGFEGVLVYDTGRMIEAYSTEQEVFLTGEAAVLRVTELGAEKDGSIEVFDLASEVALGLGYALQAELYRDEEDLANYSLAQVFDMLERDGLTGYVDLQFSGKRGNGTVYYLDGSPVEAVIMSTTGKLVCGEQVFHKFLEIGAHIQPQVKVFRTADPRSIQEDDSFIIPWLHPEHLAFWTDFFAYMNRLMAENFKKPQLMPLYESACRELTDPYPFLDPDRGAIEVDGSGRLHIRRLLAYPTLVQGWTMALKQVFHQVPLRRFKKLHVDRIIAEVEALAETHQLEHRPFDLSKMVQQIFRGIGE